jgi:phosphoenolpyruvate carboxylase
MSTDDIPEKDLPLRNDIRLLGRILGDTVRQQEGDAVFAIAERTISVDAARRMPVR